MYMAEGLDTGDMLLKSRTEIGPEETSGELHDRLSQMGAELIVETLKEVEAGTVRRTPQGDAETSYASMLTKELGKIDWGRPAGELHNLVRGLSPWPVAETVYNKKRLQDTPGEGCPGIPRCAGRSSPPQGLLCGWPAGAIPLWSWRRFNMRAEREWAEKSSYVGTGLTRVRCLERQRSNI